MAKKNRVKKKTKKIVLLSILAVVLIGIATVFIINSTYRYDPTGAAGALADGEKGVLTLEYNGADGKTEKETITYDKAEKLTLPTLTKEGYYFSGWTIGETYVGLETALTAKTATAKAQFDKDYSALTSACAVYTDENNYTEYEVGEYDTVNTEAANVFVDGGYKLTVYSKANFAGEETKVYYSGKYKGYIGSMKVEQVKSESLTVASLSDETKLELLTTFAPRFWWDESEKFYASNIEFAAQNMQKELSPTGNIYYRDDVTSSNYMQDFLYGDLEHAKAYGFATEKEFKYLDLSYFYYAPYNLGKTIAGMEFGNHIGDWEHVTVRLLVKKAGGSITLRPVVMDYSAHFMRNYVAWDEIETVKGTHPVAYIACGSHGMWKEAGEHIYVDAFVVKLKDFTSQGTAWDLWERGNLETYTYDALKHEGKGIGGSEWNADFGINCFEEGGGVTIWGNRGWRPPITIYPRFDSAPSGPQHKQSLNNYYTINGKGD